jgi:hypothetical protein
MSIDSRIHRLIQISLLVTLSVMPGASGFAGVFDDRGFSPNRDYFSQLPYEHIDPMTGNLLLTFTDLVLPGNAGFDLKIQRTYNSKIYLDYENGAAFDEDTWAGVGWTLHLGRIMNSNSDFPTLEMPDGSRHRLYRHVSPFPAGCSDCFITKDYWIWDRNTRKLKLPSGLVYTFGPSVGSSPGWAYTTEIVDPFGNSVGVAYFTDPQDAISQITQTLGSGQVRTVTFGLNSTYKSIATMSYTGSRSYAWVYTSLATDQAGFSRLDSVQPPTGSPWRYQYNSTTPPKWELIGLTTPHGGQINYEYAEFTGYLGNTDPIRFHGVSKRTTAGRDMPSGVWTYSYFGGGLTNQSSISSPCGTTTYTFLGIGNSNAGAAWKVGLLASRTVSDATSSEATSYFYRPPLLGDRVSDEDVMIGPNTDSDVYVPLVATQTITRGSVGLTTQNTYASTNFNDFGRPYLTTETGTAGQRTTSRTFKYGFTPYIRDRIESETVSFAGASFTTSFQYNLPNGFTLNKTTYGIPLNFTPDARGNVATVRDGNNHTTSYTYSWGVRQSVRTAKYPSQDSLFWVINPEGTVASESRADAGTTNYLYDGLFRLTSESPPGTNPIIYEHAPDGSWTRRSRGGASGSAITTFLDGFGRASSTSNLAGVSTDLAYDACGRRTYESYPFDATRPNTGTTYAFDALGRIRERKNLPDGSLVKYEYLGADGLDVRITDENNHATEQSWDGFGSPGDSWLVAVKDANLQTTSYTYNTLGSLKTANQTGSARGWTYNSRNLLETETHPESGTVVYTYDGAGVVETRTDAEFGLTRFIHDANNRLETIDRLGGNTTYDTSFTYDMADNRLSATNSFVRSDYTYDAVRRLRTRKDTIGSREFWTTYTYTGNDELEKITYPASTPPIREVLYRYGNESRLSRVGKPGAETLYASGFTYHPSGAVESYSWGNGQSSSFAYDTRYRLRTTAVPQLVLTYQYLPNGNVDWISDTRGTGWFQDFGYDNIDRLTSAVGPWGGGSFGYDVLGNRTSKSVNGSATYTYNSATNRLTSVTGSGADSFLYDDNGNLKSSAGGTYTYTPENMMETGGGAIYRYDGDAMRKVKTIGGDTRHFIHGPGGQILSEITESCNGTVLESARDYVYAGGRLLAAIEPDSPTFELSGPTLVPESQSATFTITLKTSAAISQAITVWFAAAAGSASAGDFTLTPGSRTFPVGSGNNATQTFTVSIVNDTAVEPDETFTVFLQNPCGGRIGNGAQSVTIEDDDATVRFAAGATTVSEGGTASLTVNLHTSHLKPTTNPVSVQYQVAPESATTADYGTPTSGTLTWATGSAGNGSAPRTVVIPITQDSSMECDETFIVTLSNLIGGTPGSPLVNRVTIVDDDLPALTLPDGAPQLEGHSGTVENRLQIKLTPSGFCKPVVVDYVVSDGSAKLADNDYTASPGTVTIPPGTGLYDIRTYVVGDMRDEPNEAFNVTVTSATNATILRRTGQATILDDDGRIATCRPIEYLPYIINVQGNYCLNRSLSTDITTGAAITIESDFVNLDLGGFKVGGGNAGFGTLTSGVYALNRKNITVRNGNIRGFYKGVFLEEDDATPGLSSGHLVQGVHVDENTFAGIWVEGVGNMARRNRVVATTGSTTVPNSEALGIVVFGPGARVLDNDVLNTTPTGSGAGFGIQLNGAAGSVVRSNRVGNEVLGNTRGIAVRGGSVNVLVIMNDTVRTDYGFVYDGTSSGKYRDNLTTGVTIPFTGGTDVGNNN